MKKQDVHTKITNDIIELMEKGEVVWRKPWKHAGAVSHSNFKSKSAYRGINAFITYATAVVNEFDSPYWLTFKQAQELGGSIKKGSKSTSIVFYAKVWVDANGKKVYQAKNVSDAEMVAQGYRKIMTPRYYNIFNLDQIDGIDYEIPQAEKNDNEILEEAERIINEMQAKPKYNIVPSERACYSPVKDEITMPRLEQFESSHGYYSVFFHEMIHATGHESRLNRDTLTASASFGSDTYSKEELVAELGSCFLCAEVGILQEEIENSVAYLQSWIKELKKDNKLIWKASQQAQKAVDFILNK